MIYLLHANEYQITPYQSWFGFKRCVDRVIMGFASNRTTLFWLFLTTFYQLWGYILYMILGLFANIFLQFHGCILYSRATYTQVYTVSKKVIFKTN